jgi:hypothetical protein
MFLIFLQRVGINKEVIEEIIEEVAEDVVDVVLEGPWGVAQPEGHDIVFEMSISAPEGGLPFFTHRHS